MRISLQVAAGYFLIVGLAGWFVLDVFVDEVKPGVRNTMEDTLVDSANLLAELLAPALVNPSAQNSDIAAALQRYRARLVDAAIWQHRKQSLDLHLYVTDIDGRVIYSTQPAEVGRDYSRWNDVFRTLHGRYGARATRADPEDSNTSVMHVAAPVLDQGRIIGVVSVAKPSASVAPIVADSRAKIRARGLLLLLITALIGALFTWHLTRAIGRLQGYAREVIAGRRGRPPHSSARELSELADVLGEMRERLEGKQYVERYVHALTHELKSPLAAIHGAAELLGEAEMPESERRRFLDNIRNQSDRLAQVADRLLELARIEQQQELTKSEHIDLWALVAEVVEAASTLAMRRGIGIELDRQRAISTPIQVCGDRFLLSRALANLLDNALGFSPTGACVQIELRFCNPERQQGTRERVEVSICDQGPGIPDYAAARVFERFFSLPRPNAGRKGTGLGLSFVHEVAELHGGSVSLDNRDLQGTCARLWLPCAVTR